jgi:hypothetical protein
MILNWIILNWIILGLALGNHNWLGLPGARHPIVAGCWFEVGCCSMLLIFESNTRTI